jgi:hypothetical protein
MAEDKRRRRIRQLAIEHVEVRPADPAGLHIDDDLTGCGLRIGDVALDQPGSGRLQDHRSHEGSMPRAGRS